MKVILVEGAGRPGHTALWGTLGPGLGSRAMATMEWAQGLGR